MTMRTIRTSTGAEILLDGDLLVIMETLYREVTLRHQLKHTFEDMSREIQHVVQQMTEDERRQYLTESLFLNTVTYENDRLERVIKRLPGA
jgi:hypothetical protein